MGGKKKTNTENETEDVFKGKDKEKRLEILEDNLTRAFLITIGSLSQKQIQSVCLQNQLDIFLFKLRYSI